MQLKLFKTLWGHTGSLQQAALQAREARFDGIEGPVPTEPARLDEMASTLEAAGLEYIAEVCTCGSAVPDRLATPAEHLADLEKKVAAAVPLQPRLVNIMGGCDAWPLETQYAFFSEGMEIGARYGLDLSFETHRSRSLFHPWVTESVLQRLPDIKLTADISHWVAVCERLLDAAPDWETMLKVAENIHHVHSRVGYPQGPQVPHPAASEYSDCLAFHQKFWEAVWQSQQERGYSVTSMTPEFGPDHYLHTLPFTNQPVADLWQINTWMGECERSHFQSYCTTRT